MLTLKLLILLKLKRLYQHLNFFKKLELKDGTYYIPLQQRFPPFSLTGEQLPGDQLIGEQALSHQLIEQRLPGQQLPGQQLLDQQLTGHQLTSHQLPSQQLIGQQLSRFPPFHPVPVNPPLAHLQESFRTPDHRRRRSVTFRGTSIIGLTKMFVHYSYFSFQFQLIMAI